MIACMSHEAFLSHRLPMQHAPAYPISLSAPLGVGDPPRVVILDDDPGLRESLTEYLLRHGLLVEGVASGEALRERLATRGCDLVILDMLIPGEDGLAILRRLSLEPAPPRIIMFSAAANEVDRVVALEMGADDYITKPSTPREILARIRAVMRRGQLELRSEEPCAPAVNIAAYNMIVFAGCRFNRRTRLLQGPNGNPIMLSSSEFVILSTLLDRPGEIISRTELVDCFLPPRDGLSERTADVLISRVRRRLAVHVKEELIRTVRGKGYTFVAPVGVEILEGH